jgi:GDP-D-mannose dehydratase
MLLKAQQKLGWKSKVKFEELARIMAKSDYEKVLKRGF